MFQEDHLPPGGAGFIELEKVSADDVLDVVSGRQKFDVNGHGKIHYIRQLRYETDFLNDMPESALIEIFQFIAADRGVTMPSAYDHLTYIIQSITE